MPLLRLNEHYVSVQGEGPNTGKMTQFVRFSGCNMRCPGWPCDTEHAINPALYRGDPKLTAEDIVSACLAKRATTGASHVCVTGGEPFMQDTQQLKQLFNELHYQAFTTDVFTNGSFIFPPFAFQGNNTIVMDWKLKSSGEGDTRVVERLQNALALGPKDAIKFVVKDEADLNEAFDIWQQLTNEVNGCKAQFYVGRVWDSEASDAYLVGYIEGRQLPWQLNVQLHKYIFPGVDRGI